MLFSKIILAVLGMGLLTFFFDKLSFRRSLSSAQQSIYDFKMKGLNGEEIDFSKYKGKMMLLVNTASKCGFTPQYEDLQQLHERFGEKVVVLGFPANNFLWQEPGNNDEIAQFCQKNYGVTFQMFEKISVKGRDQHPLFNWLEKKSGRKPSWNFCKYLIGRNGEVLGFFGPKVKPLDNEIVSKIN
jgi:glutathione peroxidase